MTELLERGNVFFAYRPRVDHEEVRGLVDVQRLFVILEPDRDHRFRRLIVGRKRLPDVEERERLWGFVDEVARGPEQVEQDLERRTYETATSGWRLQAEARPAGEGVYVIVRHGDHTHLAYELELPEEPGEAQQELNIAPEASYIIVVKNPQAPSPAEATLVPEQTPELPEPLKEHFGGRRFIPADPPELLDVEGFEFVLIGASEDVARELDVDLDPERETLESADIVRELNMRPDEHPTEPLTEGKWR
jgi:hypothetical protein